METSPIFVLGTLLFIGFFVGQLASKAGLPSVTGYILAGVLLNPQVTGIVSPSFVSASSLATELTLAVITFSVGASLYLPAIKQLGKSIGTIALFEAEFAALSIAAGFMLLIPVFMPELAQYAIPMAILFGALGSPTDPSATLAVSHEYKCDGPVIRTVMGVAALDDGIAMLNYSVAAAVAAGLLAHTAFGFNSVLEPLLDITKSVGTGVVLGTLFVLTEKKIKSDSNAQMLTLFLGLLYFCYGLAQKLNADPLLAVMASGFVVVNFGRWSRRVPEIVSGSIEEVVFILFFTVSGMKLDFSVLESSLMLVLIFVLLRFTGKFFGTALGAGLTSAGPSVRRYAGFCLIPQGGIVIGLALALHSMPVFQPFSDILVSVILGVVLINELAGPLAAKWALARSGEIH